MRTALILGALLIVAGCDRGRTAQEGAGAGSAAGSVSGEGVECRTAGRWTRDCTVERDGDTLTIRHADGGFRRFRVLSDGHGLEAADGSEGAKVTIVDGQRIEVTVGSDAYRLPAKVAGR